MSNTLKIPASRTFLTSDFEPVESEDEADLIKTVKADGSIEFSRPLHDGNQMKAAGNPNHDARGRFASGANAAGGTSTLEGDFNISLFSPTAKKKEVVEQLCKELGFSPEQVNIRSNSGPEFTVDGVEMETAANYNPSTREITLFAGAWQSTDENLRGIFAHEVNHDRWSSVQGVYATEERRVQDFITSSDNDVLNRNFTARDKVRPDGPNANSWTVYQGLFEYLNPMGNEYDNLPKLDGVTEYSKKYWRQYESDPTAHNRNRAIDETLAETEFLRVSKKTHKGVSPVWVRLQKAVKDAHREIRRYAYENQ